MTGNGLDEVFEQFKKINSNHAETKVIGTILFGLSERYFKTSRKTIDWYNWVLQNNNEEKKQTLLQNVDYALAIGAALFKIYLAEEVGNYDEAIKRFNGKGKGAGNPHHLKNVTDKAAKVRKMNFNCLKESEIDLMDRLCEILDSEKECEQMINDIWGSSKKSYDI